MFISNITFLHDKYNFAKPFVYSTKYISVVKLDSVGDKVKYWVTTILPFPYFGKTLSPFSIMSQAMLCIGDTQYPYLW